MRLFSATTLYPTYRARLRELRDAASATTFSESMAVFLDDRYGATHLLAPILDQSPEAFLAIGTEARIQRLWASEKGLPSHVSLEEILLAQIEDHRTEVFYCHDPVAFPDAFLAKLPSCVRKTIAWRAAPTRTTDFLGYDLLVNNFPGILAEYREMGANADYFFPAFDPVMEEHDRPWDARVTDILFVGAFSRHHSRRTRMLEAVAHLSADRTVALHLDISRGTRLAETVFGIAGPLRSWRRPAPIKRASRGPLFGRDLYTALGNAKIVLNGAVDMVGAERGNMRCWEALGCGALMVSDEGTYPEGFGKETLGLYSDHEKVAETALDWLDKPSLAADVARAGSRMLRSRYSKEKQWARFLDLVG